MTIHVDGLGPLLDAARALGLVLGTSFNADWFNHPDTYVGRMLRDPDQRDALVRSLDALFMRDDDASTDAKGRKWVGVARAEGVAFYVVVHPRSSGGTDVGLGVRLETNAPSPESRVGAYVPLFVVPADGDARVALGTSDGRVEVEAHVTFSTSADAVLQGFGVRVDVPTHAPLASGEAPPLIVVSLDGLKLPGQSAARNVVLGDAGLVDLGEDVVRLVSGLLRDAARTAAQEIAEILALVGLSDDPALPPLPIDRLFVEGAPAMQHWALDILASPTALSAWLGHVATLVRRGASVTPPARPGEPHRVVWTLASGAEAGLTLRGAAVAGGATLLELGGSLRWEAPGSAPGGGVALEIIALRATLGATPSLLGLPSVSVYGRVGPRVSPGALLPPTPPAGPLPSIAARAFRLGLALGEDRKIAFVLALDDVTIGSHVYPSLDLTNPSTLADVASTSLDTIVGNALAGLGPAGNLVRAVLGLDAPPTATSWPPIAPVHVIDLLGRPLESVLDYHARVLATFSDGYADILGTIGSLFLPGPPRAALGSGTEIAPWRMDLATAPGGSPRVMLLAWQREGAVRFALAADATVVDLGGSCPRIASRLQADLAAVDFAHRTANPFPWFGGKLEFTGRAAGPLRIGPADAAIVVDRIGFELALADGAFGARVLTPGLGLDVGGEVAPLTLPTVDSAGTFVGTVPYRAIELLSGGILRFIGSPLARELAIVLGWIPSARAGLSVERLVADPLRAIGEWLEGIPAETKARWLSYVVGGAAAPGLSTGLLAGRGDEVSPYIVPLGATTTWPATRHAYVFAQTPRGPEKERDDFRPTELLSLLAATRPAASADYAEVLAKAFHRAAASHEDVHDLLQDRGDLASGLATLMSRWAASDGVTPVALATYTDATLVRWERVAAHDLWRRWGDGRAHGVVTDDVTIFVTLDPEAWTTVGRDRRIDLSAAGRAPESFDLGNVESLDGPWVVDLPRRSAAIVAPSDDPTERQAARLARVVDAVFAKAGRNVTLIADRAAGHAARHVAATHARVARVVTLGAPHGGVSVGALDDQPFAAAHRLLAACVPAVDPSRPEIPELAIGRALLASLDDVYRGRVGDIDELAPPPAPLPVPSSVTRICVAGVVSEIEAQKAVIALAIRALQGFFEEAEEEESDAGDDAEDDESFAVGIGVREAIGTDVVVTTDTRLRLWKLGEAELDPLLRLRVELARPGGWLVGGPRPGRPPGAPRTPSLRRATFDIEIPLADDDEPARFEAVLHEAEAMGFARTRWEITSSEASGDGLDAAARVLLGRVFEALGPLPATGPARAVADALAALGLASATPSTGGAFGVASDVLDRLRLDPRAFFEVVRRDRSAADVARALALVTGGTSSGSVVALSFAGVTATIDAASGVVSLDATSVALGGGVDLVDTHLRLEPGRDSAGRLGLALGGEGPGGRPVLEVTADPLTVRVTFQGSEREVVALYPTASLDGIARFVRDVVPEQLLWAGITFIRALDPAVRTVLDPLLRVFGLLRALPAPSTDDRVVLPLGLLSAPGHWLLAGASLGAVDGRVDPNRLRDLFDALGNLLGLRPPSTPSGRCVLPFGVTIAASGDATTRTRIDVAVEQPVAAGLPLSVGGALGVILPDRSGPLGARVEVRLGVGSGTTTTALVVAAGTDGASIALDFGGGRRLSIYPAGPGITDLGTAAVSAVTYALPIALDALSGLASPPAAATFAGALRGLGDALGIRVASHFSSEQIAQLAADPAAELPRRLVANLGPGLAALAGLLAPAMPSGWSVSASGSALALTRTGAFTASFTPTPGAMRFGVDISPITVFASARVEGTLVIDERGLGRLRAAFTVDPGAPLVAGPLRIAPVVEVDFGREAPAPALGFGFGLTSTKQLLGVVRFAPVSFAIEGRGATLEEAAVLFVVPLVADLALSATEVQALLARNVFPTRTLRQLLEGVVLSSTGAFDPAVLEPSNLWPRTLRLAANVAQAAGSLPIAPLTVAVATRTVGPANEFGIGLSIADGERLVLVDADTWVGLEVDATWVAGVGSPGLALYLLRLEGTTPSAMFDLAIRGLGVRIGKRQGPLLDTGLTIDSLAMHGMIEFDTTGLTAGGGQLELAGLAIPLDGATGGNDGVASGVLRDARNGNEHPEPRFSPAFAVQSSPTGPKFDLRAGPGDGPWWLPIRRGFGPVYLEQVGFGVRKANDRIEEIKVLVDGRASQLGLTVSVDDLAVGVSTTEPLDRASSWSVSMAGLSVAAETSGVRIAGGLRKREPQIDYIGMLSVSFGVYGLTAYGGYAEREEGGERYSSFFLFGALNAPIGGPPAFFVTGIGAGVGINRTLELPSDFDHFGTYPLIRALDPSAPINQGTADDALTVLESTFRPRRGTFWIAAGISFTSFVLVQGVAVLAVEIGDGLTIALLALARASLPRPEATLVQIELALLARFSTKEGVIWIQGQLTDNSWLLTRDCRLTGGFAFVTWFKGPHKGEFVVTIGGYHPSFSREDYPVVPRLGLTWNVSDILVIKGESYFALTSEAVMAGLRVEARLNAGPLWAYVKIGADGIVYFDPFWFSVSVFCEIGAGITIDLDLGFLGHLRITISIHLGATVLVEGPEFRGRATIDLGVCSAEVAFGNWNGAEPPRLPWSAFKTKYIEQGGGEDTAVLTVTVGSGAQPASPAAGGKPPAGTSDDPLLVIPEFRLEVRSKAAVEELVYASSSGDRTEHLATLAVAPMRAASAGSRLRISFRALSTGDDRMPTFGPVDKATREAFPKGVWIAEDDRGPVPKGEVVEAGSGATLVSSPTFGDETPEIDYHQVEVGPRLPLPLLGEAADRVRVVDLGRAAEVFTATLPRERSGVMTVAARWLAASESSVASVALSRRSVAPRLTPLALGLGAAPSEHTPPPAPPPRPIVRPDDGRVTPLLEAILSLPSQAIAERPRTSVGDDRRRGATVVTAPTLASVRSRLVPLGPMRLTMSSPSATVHGRTLLGTVVPFSGRAGGGTELRDAIGQGRDRLCGKVPARDDDARAAAAARGIRVYRLTPSAPTRAGAASSGRGHVEIGGESRVVLLAPMGNVVLDVTASKHRLALPRDVERVVVVPSAPHSLDVAGFVAATRLAQVGRKTMIGPGCVVDASSLRVRRFGVSEVRAAWVRAGEALIGSNELVVRFPFVPRSLAVVLEPAPRSGRSTSAISAGAEEEDFDLGGRGLRLTKVDRALVAGGSTVVFYEVASEEQPPSSALLSATITVASTDRAHVAGVLASAADHATFASRLREHDPDDLLGALSGDDRSLPIRFLPPEAAPARRA